MFTTFMNNLCHLSHMHFMSHIFSINIYCRSFCILNLSRFALETFLFFFAIHAFFILVRTIVKKILIENFSIYTCTSTSVRKQYRNGKHFLRTTLSNNLFLIYFYKNICIKYALDCALFSIFSCIRKITYLPFIYSFFYMT